MNQRGKKSGYGNRGKTNYVFPPFPQPLLLLTNQMKKQPTKTKTIVYTKSLADPSVDVLALQNLIPTSCNFSHEFPALGTYTVRGRNNNGS